jgi:hypothetical protein
VAVKLIHSDADFRAGELGSLIVMVGKRSPDNAAFNRIYDVQEEAIRRHGRATVLTVLSHFDGPLKADKATQQARTEGLAKLGDAVRGVALTVTVTGLKGNILRMILTGASLFMAGRMRNQIFGSIEDAAKWIRSLPGQDAGLVRDETLAAQIAAFVALTD